MQQIFQYAGAAKTIYGAVAGGEGDSLEHLSEDPSELAIYGKVLFYPSSSKHNIADGVF